ATTAATTYSVVVRSVAGARCRGPDRGPTPARSHRRSPAGPPGGARRCAAPAPRGRPAVGARPRPPPGRGNEAPDRRRSAAGAPGEIAAVADVAARAPAGRAAARRTRSRRPMLAPARPLDRELQRHWQPAGVRTISRLPLRRLRQPPAVSRLSTATSGANGSA